MTIPINLLTNLSLALQSGSGSTFWMPPESSTVAGQVDAAFYFIYWIAVFFFVGIVTAMVIIVIKYRSREGHKPKKAPNHSLALELTWSIIPLILVIFIFWTNFRTFISLETPPANSYQVNVVAMKWKWLFEYPNGFVSEELHVPAEKPVTLTLRSEDVIHSFFVPDFRIKKDVVPGRFNKTWFEAKEPGEHWVLCAEYCGTKHSDMLAKLVVHSAEGFADWLAKADTMYDSYAPFEAGEAMFQRYGCAQCHSVDGKASTGPTFLDAYNTERTFVDGTITVMDENYIRESILDPQAKVVKGFQPVMPTFQGKLKENQIAWIIAYIKICSSHTPQAELDSASAIPEPPAAEEGANGAANGEGAVPEEGNSAATENEAPAEGSGQGE